MRVFIFTLISTLFLVNYSSAQNLMDSLSAHYPLDGDATDMTSNGNDGTITSAALSTDRFDMVDMAYDFDGQGDSINFGNEAAFRFGTSDFTISYWFFYPGDERYQMLLGKRQILGGYPQYGFYFNGVFFNGPSNLTKKIGFFMRPDGGNDSHARVIQDSEDLTPGWHCVTATNDYDGDLSLYVDDELIGTDDTDMQGFPVDGGAASFVAGKSDGFLDMEGKLDNIYVFRRVLSQGEITKLCAERTGTTPVEPIAATIEIELMPNPTVSTLNIKVEDVEVSSYSIFDSAGKLLQKGKFVEQINVSDIPVGVHFIRFEQKNGQVLAVKKFIKRAKRA